MRPPLKQEGRFDQKLALYQKLTVSLFFPSLLSLFGFVMARVGGLLGFATCFAAVKAIDGALPEAGSSRLLWGLIISIALAALFLYLTLAAAKGKGWALYLAAGLYAADFLGCFFFSPSDLGVYLSMIILHVAFLALQSADIVYYRLATKAYRELAEKGLGEKRAK